MPPDGGGLESPFPWTDSLPHPQHPGSRFWFSVPLSRFPSSPACLTKPALHTSPRASAQPSREKEQVIQTQGLVRHPQPQPQSPSYPTCPPPWVASDSAVVQSLKPFSCFLTLEEHVSEEFIIMGKKTQ